MSPPVNPVASDAQLPPRTGVVIIGGGIIGVTTALFLARRGHAVVLCEKGRIGGEQSSRNWGWCRTMGRDEREIPLALESLRLWRGMNQRTGRETGFRQAGIVYYCETEKEVAEQEAWLEQARQYQMDARMLRGADIAAVAPGAATPFVAALHTPTDGRAEPSHAAPAIAEAARAHGATILTDCAVRSIDLQGGRIAGVVTEKGRIACESVVLAGGAWSRLFCGNAGIDLPQLKVLASVFRTTPVKGPEVTGGAGVFAFRKRLDGGYTVARRNRERGGHHAGLLPPAAGLPADPAPQLRRDPHAPQPPLVGGMRAEAALDRPTRRRPFEAVRVLDPAPRQATLAEGRAALARAFPVFAGAQVAESWGGMIDVTPDAVPVISQVDRIPGFFIATGFSGHGFGIGPGAGRLIADLVAGDTPVVDPAPFRLDRFTRAR